MIIGYHITRYPPFDGISVSSIFLINVCLFSLKMIALSDVAELNMFVARSAQPMISLLLSFVRRYLIVKENRITDRF